MTIILVLRKTKQGALMTIGCGSDIYHYKMFRKVGQFQPPGLPRSTTVCLPLQQVTISLALHSTLEHLDNKDTYVRLLFIDYNSAFNKIIPTKLIFKLCGLGLGTPLCDWILNFLIHRPQSVRISNNASATIILNTGAPQDCVLSLLVFVHP